MKSWKQYLLVLFATAFLFAGCSDQADHNNSQITGTDTENTESTQVVEIPEPQKIRLMMVGDDLLHMGIVNTGEQEDGTRDYSILFDALEQHLERADIKIINQETIMAGNQKGLSGYPKFNSPTEVGDAIADAGFNVVLHASNHCADQNLSGLLNCLEYWKSYPQVVATGIYEEDEDGQDIALVEIDGVTFAILNYTYGPNTETLDASLQGHIGMLCAWNKNTGSIDFGTLHPDVLTDIEEAEKIADVVIVCPHWGVEYATTPSSTQQKFAEQMTEAGADLIIGTHPHVVQPISWVESENGNKALCYYSLGNYVSTQKMGIAMLEAMAWVTFEVEEDGVVIVEDETGVVPMVCHYRSNPVRFEQVYFLDEYTEELAKAHGIHQYGGVNLTLSDLEKWSDEILGDWVLDSRAILEEK